MLIFISLRKMNISDLALRATYNSGKYYLCKPVLNVMAALKVYIFQVAWSGRKMLLNQIVQDFKVKTDRQTDRHLLMPDEFLGLGIQWNM